MTIVYTTLIIYINVVKISYGIDKGETPFKVRSFQGVGVRRYAVRRGSESSTQNPVISYEDIKIYF